MESLDFQVFQAFDILSNLESLDFYGRICQKLPREIGSLDYLVIRRMKSLDQFSKHPGKFGFTSLLAWKVWSLQIDLLL